MHRFRSAWKAAFSPRIFEMNNYGQRYWASATFRLVRIYLSGSGGITRRSAGRWLLMRLGGTRINADLLGDYVRATIIDRGPVPRIPPLRLLGGLEAQGDKFTARTEVERVFKQDRIADFETTTPGYTLVNASVSLKPFANSSRTSLLLSANNIFDVVARRHSSFLKDFAPLAGRDIRVSLRFGL